MSNEIRTLIAQFLTERLQAKKASLTKLDVKHSSLDHQFERETWIADAAHRVGQLQLATHSLKPIHPDAKGTNLYCHPTALGAQSEVGSHVLGPHFAADVVGNAAALDVYKFLRLEHGGKTLLDRILDDDDELALAFTDDITRGREWMRAFRNITEPRESRRSHTYAKQLYWLIGEDPCDTDDFHLLAPLYPTSLVHRVYQTINEDRFSDQAKEARRARREGSFSEVGFREYPDLAMQKLGGTKPQNVSQLNSERRGINYLLGSLPPNWASPGLKPPLSLNSTFLRFSRRPRVVEAVRILRRFLQSGPPPNVQTRQRRQSLIDDLIDELLIFTAEHRDLEPGWSADPACNLSIAEKLWLDPDRGLHDPEFAVLAGSLLWPDEVSHSFANWLNGRLARPLAMADAEHREWRDALREVLTHV